MKFIKQIWPAVTLILLASAVLLISDLKNRNRTSKRKNIILPSIAIFQIASTQILDSNVEGVMESLREGGMIADDESNVKKFNPQGDFPTASAIANEMVNGNYDILITSSTVALQTVAQANRSTKKRHIFGAVTDPYTAGVGITGPDKNQHPPYLTGVGTFQPVQPAFRIVKEMNPGIKRIGTVWNPGEKCSEACLKKARTICRELGIELIEATASQTAEVSDALNSLLSQNIEAIWVGGDTVAMSSVKMLIHKGKEFNIPVFTNDPQDAEKGALFGLGADYKTVGNYVGKIAVEVLNGKSPADFRITNMVPRMFNVNHNTLKSLSSTNWSLTNRLKTLEKQSKVINKPKRSGALRAQPGKNYNIALIYYAPLPIFDTAINVFRKEIMKYGFIDGNNLTIKLYHPSNNISMIPQVVKSAESQNPDLIVALSSPCLSGAIAQAKNTNIVFGIVSAPFKAGVGKSRTDHLPNVTGVIHNTGTPEMFKWVHQLFPQCKRVGMLYDPSSVNSVKEVDDLNRILPKLGMELVPATLSNSSEVVINLEALLDKSIDVYFTIGDSLVANVLPTIISKCATKNIPVTADDAELMGSGAILSCAAGVRENAQQVAKLAAKVLCGKSPAEIPIENTEHNEMTLDLLSAQKNHVRIPLDAMLRCDRFFNVSSLRNGKPARIAMINLITNPLMDEAIKGTIAGIESLGLKQGKDFTVDSYNAQGDIAKISQIIDAAANTKPDVIVTLTTPVLTAAVNKIKDIPVVFCVASDPVKLGLIKHQRPPNLCGIHDNPPVDKLLDMALRYNPVLDTVATIYDPAQMNSLISVKKLRKAAATRKIKLLEGTASSVSELPLSVGALIQRGADAILISADNLTITGFPAILKTSQAAGIPLFSTEPSLTKTGATGAIGNDYYDWGVQGGELAARIIAGVNPSELPIEPASKIVIVEPPPREMKHNTKLNQSKVYDIRLVMYTHAVFTEEARDGVIEGLKQAGFIRDKNYKLTEYNANADIPTLSSIMRTVTTDRPDLVVALTTPVLQTAMRFVPGNIPIVFTGVADGVLAGAGKTPEKHKANITGITTRSPFKGMSKILKTTLPGLRTAGTLFTPSEVNSVLYKDLLAEELKPYGIKLTAVPVTSVAEISMAMDALCRKDIQAVCQIMDNTTRPGFHNQVEKATENNLPVFTFSGSQIALGSTLSLAKDFIQAGIEAGHLAAKILKGANPANIPFRNVQKESLIINMELAEKYHLKLSPEILKNAKIYKK